MVTAQKREENLQDVGISITAFSGNQLQQLGMTRSVDIAQQVPAMQLQTFTPAFTIINLRGISQNNFQDNLEAPVAVYVDGAYIPSMNAINGLLFDTKRVEVLRGPQGTLFGRNTTGGLVQYITNGATQEELNGYAEGTSVIITRARQKARSAVQSARIGAAGRRPAGRKMMAMWNP